MKSSLLFFVIACLAQVASAAESAKVTVSYAKLDFNTTSTALNQAVGGMVNISINSTAKDVASVQVPGAGSYPITLNNGAASVNGADVRMLLGPKFADIKKLCEGVLEYNKKDSLNTVFDTKINFTLNNKTGAVVASTTVDYQLGLQCMRPAGKPAAAAPATPATPAKPATPPAQPMALTCPTPSAFGLTPTPNELSGFSGTGPGLGGRIGGSYFPFAEATMSGDKKNMFCMYKVGAGQVAFYSKLVPPNMTCAPHGAGFECK